MRKLVIIITLCASGFLAVSCSKDEPANQPPSVVQLTYPTQDLLCISNVIPFNWSDATDPENDVLEYNIIVAKDRQLTDVVENVTLSASQIEIILEKGTPFYWQVSAVDEVNNQMSTSATFAFFTKGNGVTNYAPFMADLKSPENNTNVSAGSLDLVWEATDTNTEDTLSYELFFGENGALSSIGTSLTVQTYAVSVVSGKTYSWKVNVIDNWGAKSVGQTFTFTVN
jgi:hypothetical protein